jgi:hypothetical protein
MLRYSTVGSHAGAFPSGMRWLVNAAARPFDGDGRRRSMRFGVGVLTAVLVVGTEAAGQVPGPPADPQPRLRLDTTLPVPAPATRERPSDSTAGLEVTATCPACPDERHGPVVNGNAPWLWGARMRFGGDVNWTAVGLVGQRNAPLPLFMTQEMGGPPRPGAPSATAPLADTRTTWQLVLQGERALWHGRHGATTGVVGEAFLPLGTWGATPTSADAATPPRRAVRGAFRVRF